MFDKYTEDKEIKVWSETGYDMAEFSISELNDMYEKASEIHENAEVKHDYLVENFLWVVAITAWSLNEDDPKGYQSDNILFYLKDETKSHGFDKDYLKWIRENSKNDLEVDNKLRNENS